MEKDQTMIFSNKSLLRLLFIWLCVNVPLYSNSRAALNESEIDEKLAAIVSYERGMSREPLIAVEKLIRESQNKLLVVSDDENLRKRAEEIIRHIK
jgi:hypothetical protein